MKRLLSIAIVISNLASFTCAAADTLTVKTLVIKRMDNAGHTLEANQMKAFTALSTRNTTENVMKNAQANVSVSHLSEIPGGLLLAGEVR
jgi:uncharacterized protein GlcG (DUF336 family)